MGGLDGVFSGPFPRSGFVPCAVSFVDVGDLGDEWVVGIWIGEHGADGKEDFGDSQGGAPLITKNI